jgi:hypothetical protein
VIGWAAAPAVTGGELVSGREIMGRGVLERRQEMPGGAGLGTAEWSGVPA